MFRLSLILVLLSFCTLNKAQKIRIGLYNSQKISNVKFTPKNGNYFVFSDTNLIYNASTKDIIEMKINNNLIDVILNGNFLNRYSEINFVAEKNENFLETKPIRPNLKSRLYESDFTVQSKNGYLEIVNEIDLENYLEGVVESEAGPGQKTEYYKVQAIISRTYAVKYWNKHQSSGFNLCDGTHCQAYLHKRNQSSLIDTAVKYTRQIILFDSINQLASTFFHANCGGQTCEPDLVWNQKMEGFSSFKDTFCVHTFQAMWTKKIPLKDWFSFIESKYNFPSWDSLSYSLAVNFEQKERKAFYIDPVYGIPLRDLRDAFKLKSTFFNCKKEGEFLVITGRGFGHGVGLCQEGAMEMAKYGYNFEQILLFYYPNRNIGKIPISPSFPRK
ncbi:MAG: SpoIID/LytB domain-containing protein [Bacteroidetes bacterium]|nr:SpoIID/LytB domain-containing protein [Bacteroidota bacterium]